MGARLWGWRLRGLCGRGGGEGVGGGWEGVGDGDGVDGVAGVGLLRGGDGVEVAGEAGAVEAALEDLGVGDRAVGSGGVVAALEGEGDGVEVALEDDAGGVDEALVLGAAGDRGAVEVGGGAQGLEVEVDDGVGLGEQAGDLGGRVAAQQEGDDERGEQHEDQGERVASAFAHLLPRVLERRRGAAFEWEKSGSGSIAAGRMPIKQGKTAFVRGGPLPGEAQRFAGKIFSWGDSGRSGSLCLVHAEERFCSVGDCTGATVLPAGGDADRRGDPGGVDGSAAAAAAAGGVVDAAAA